MTLSQKMLAEIKPLGKITDAEVKKNNSESGLWVVIHGKVFDLTNFYMEHPGGWDVIEEVAGKDGTKEYEAGDHRIESIRDLKTYYIGEYEGKKLTLAEKKEQQAKEYREKIKKEKQHDYGRQILGFAVSSMLVLMITYFVYNIIQSGGSIT